ncbi:Golgi to ER traffic protein 4 homolog [Leptopilina boulardi]|uniref:Golgi to ER traffic protein 4 homolog n=1 Tax=Leptopilina boulardi TaxID=63433 RepID=UPI0021F61FB4|nr:Golgi to ER traffic protein 4 homolog [Leptopilina boulardi]
MASQRSHGVERVLSKLESSINSGNYYEAHQMYRTLYFRYLGQRKYPELLKLLYKGCLLLTQHNQFTSGADLGILYIDVLTKAVPNPSECYFKEIVNLLSVMSPSTPERETFVHEALRWSAKGTNYKTGHPDLHQKIAEVFWNEKNYYLARQHFLCSKDGSGYASMLVELHLEKGYFREIDLFIAQAVLQYLCLSNKATAQEVFDLYTLRHPRIEGPPYIYPLLNFLFFLLKTIDSGKVAVFTILCKQYRICISRDPSYEQYLDKIGQLFFNVAPARPRNQGIFGSLLQSFFDGLGDEEFNVEEQNAASTSQAGQELD